MLEFVEIALDFVRVFAVDGDADAVGVRAEFLDVLMGRGWFGSVASQRLATFLSAQIS